MAVTVICALATSSWPQTPGARLPRFEDYPVTEFFKGTPAAPILTTPEERQYRTRIREGVQKGWGVFHDGKEQQGPNFAGRYIVVQWDCGSPCRMVVVVDASNGTVYPGPNCPGEIGIGTITLPLLQVGWSVPSVADIEFHVNSRLMIVKATPDVRQLLSPSYTYYFQWNDNKWHLLRQVRLEKERP